MLSVHDDARASDRPRIAIAATVYQQELVLRAVALDLANDPQWQALVHYDARLLGSTRSQAEAKRFFTAPSGQTDPAAELAATIAAFFELLPRAGEDDAPQCMFVARFAWLDAVLGFDPERLPRLACPNFERWRAGIGGRRLTLVFPEAFISSPASMFGHTLLRLDDGEERPELLGYAIDFSGEMGDDGVAEYLVKGFTGFYPGFFAVGPWYEKLERYADWENRDLWEYPLDLDPAEVEFIVKHLWELRGISFPYYFLDENCSYQLLGLLEVARPDARLRDEFPITVIPVDTVRALAAAGWVRDARYRPSPATKLRVDAAALSAPHRRLAREIARGLVAPGSEEVAALAPRERAIVLSVAYEALRFDFLSRTGDDAEARRRSRSILVARSQVGREVKGDPLAGSVPVPRLPPEQGHGTARVSLTGGWRDGDGYLEAGFRGALHDFMDPQDGHPRSSQVQVLDTRVRFIPESTHVRLEQLTVLDIVSLPPQSEFFRRVAWKASTGLSTRLVRESPRPAHRGFDPEPVFRTNGGAGLAFELGGRALAYGFGDATLDAGRALENDVSFGPGATAGVYVDLFADVARTHFFGGITRFAVGDRTTWIRGGIEQRVSVGRRTALQFRGQVNRQDGDEWYEAGMAASFYF